MINSYIPEQLIRELEDIFSFTKLPSMAEIKAGITIQEIAYRSGVRDVIETLRHASAHGADETPLL